MLYQGVYMEYHNKYDGIQILVNLLKMERLIPIFGSGFSGGMPAHNGCVPMGPKCTELMKDILRKYSGKIFKEDDIDVMDFGETARWFKSETLKGNIPEGEYIKFFRDYFTNVNLDEIRRNVLMLPWKNAYTN